MPERKACPDCGSNLGPSATKCRCGWLAKSATAASVPGLPRNGNGRYFNPCEAYGCPLAGTLSPNGGGHGPWWCFVHHQHSDRDLQQVTALIRRNGDLYREHVEAIGNGDRLAETRTAKAFIDACNPDLALLREAALYRELV